MKFSKLLDFQSDPKIFSVSNQSNKHSDLSRAMLPNHPCMNNKAHDRIARIHLPVAPKCNIHCLYCERKLSAPASSGCGPGSAAQILSPEQALSRTVAFLKEFGLDSIVGIAGPGDPLANPETFRTLTLIRNRFPMARLCLCTNGLNLPDSMERLIEMRVQHLSITINGIQPNILARLQSRIRKNGQCLGGIDGAKVLLENQLAGLEMATKAGMLVKVNTVVVPDINGSHIEFIAHMAAKLGACIYNPMPLIPRGAFREKAKPSLAYMAELRKRCARILPVFNKCKQCSADAVGIPGRESCLCKKAVMA